MTGELKTQIRRGRQPEQDVIDLAGLCVEQVEVYSWPHSGPVTVDLTGVILPWLIDRLRAAGLKIEDPRGEKR